MWMELELFSFSARLYEKRGMIGAPGSKQVSKEGKEKKACPCSHRHFEPRDRSNAITPSHPPNEKNAFVLSSPSPSPKRTPSSSRSVLHNNPLGHAIHDAGVKLDRVIAREANLLGQVVG